MALRLVLTVLDEEIHLKWSLLPITSVSENEQRQVISHQHHRCFFEGYCISPL